MNHDKENTKVDAAHHKLHDLTQFMQDILLFYETVRPISGPSLQEQPYEMSLGSESELPAIMLKKSLSRFRDIQAAFHYEDKYPLSSEAFYDADRKNIAHHLLSSRISLTRDPNGEPMIILRLFLDEGLYKGGENAEKVITTYSSQYASEPDDETHAYGAFSQMLRVLRTLSLKDSFLTRINELVHKVKNENIGHRDQLVNHN